MPDLPDEIDATENPLSIESTKLVGAYTADFHHHEHAAPKPEYSVEAVARELADANAVGIPGPAGSASESKEYVPADSNGQQHANAGGSRQP